MATTIHTAHAKWVCKFLITLHLKDRIDTSHSENKFQIYWEFEYMVTATTDTANAKCAINVWKNNPLVWLHLGGRIQKMASRVIKS